MHERGGELWGFWVLGGVFLLLFFCGVVIFGGFGGWFIGVGGFWELFYHNLVFGSILHCISSPSRWGPENVFGSVENDRNGIKGEEGLMEPSQPNPSPVV